MAIGIDSQLGASAPAIRRRSVTRPPGPAATAASRVSRAGLVLGSLAIASAAFAVWRLIETWHVSPRAASHHVSILGQKLTYPAANLDAVIVLVIAALGVTVIVNVVTGAAREVVAATRMARRIREGRLTREDDVVVLDDPRPRAFCAGLARPRVYVSRGAMDLLDDEALGAMLEHEREHVRRRDPLRLAASRVLGRALFFLPPYRTLLGRQHELAELSADESAVGVDAANASALARAMLSFLDSSESESVGIDPARVDHLLGGGQSWGFPAVQCLVCAAVVLGLSATAVLAGALASGSATLSPPFLSAQPCVVVLALIPTALALIAIRVSRRTILKP